MLQRTHQGLYNSRKDVARRWTIEPCARRKHALFFLLSLRTAPLPTLQYAIRIITPIAPQPTDRLQFVINCFLKQCIDVDRNHKLILDKRANKRRNPDVTTSYCAIYCSHHGGIEDNNNTVSSSSQLLDESVPNLSLSMKLLQCEAPPKDLLVYFFNVPSIQCSLSMK